MPNFSFDSDRANEANLERARSGFCLDRRSSNSSVDSLSSFTSVITALPQYSATDNSSSVPDDSSFLRSSLPSTASEVTLVNLRRPLPPIPTTLSVPPRYSLLSQRSSILRSLPSSYPIDTQENAVGSHIDHSFPIRNNKPWATLLTFTSESVPGLVQETRPKPKLPRFLGGEPISGMVKLDLESSQTIQQISITLRGKIVTGSLVDEAKTLLDYKHILWHKSMGHPPSLSPSVSNKGKKTQGRFLGSYQFPFSFPFPYRVNIDSCEAIIPDGISSFSLATSSPSPKDRFPSFNDVEPPLESSSQIANVPNFSQQSEGAVGMKKKRSSQAQSAITGDDSTAQSQICLTPQSFGEPGITASVQYELIVDIVHGFLKPDSRIKTGVSYLPCIPSPLPSLKRRQADENDALAPGPMADPDGWFVLPSTVLRGQLGAGGARQVKIDCTLYLANPLSYTRGTFIPCYLKLSCEDSDALNILSAPNIPSVRLVRRLRHFMPHGGDASEINPGESALTGVTGWFTVLPVVAGGKGASKKTVMSEMSEAVWWVPPKDVLQEPYTRYLAGEIHLARNLEPSSACSLFQIEYFVEILPFSFAGFEPMAPREGMSRDEILDQVFAAHPVNITTIYAPDAPLPVPFTEPPLNRRKQIVDRLPRSNVSESLW